MSTVPIVGAAVILLTIAGHSTALIFTSSGTGGDKCGNRTCLKGLAKCMNGACQCKDKYVRGNGNLNCYKKNELRTEVFNDPSVRNYDGKLTDLPISCRYLLTHVVTDLKNTARKVVGSCELKVFTFHSKWLGKFYVQGTDVLMRLEFNNGSRHEVSIRKQGQAESGQYEYTVNATKGLFKDDGPFKNDNVTYTDSLTGLKIKLYIDEANNLCVIRVRRCGWTIVLRAYDTVDRRMQPQIPGMTCAFNCAYHVEFESPDQVISLIPRTQHNGFTMESILLTNLTAMETLIYRALTSGVNQSQPGGNDACMESKSTLQRCSVFGTLQRAFRECTWILRSPRFINCYDKTINGADIMRLFNNCVDIYCNNLSCNYVIGMINATTCQDTRGYIKLHKFVSGARCP